MTNLQQFAKQEFVSLETFRKSGEGIKSPMWFVQEGNTFYFWTAGDTAKVRRILNNPQVKIAPCKRLGAVTGEWIPGLATIEPSATSVQYVEMLLAKKLGFGYKVFRFIDGLRDKSKGSQRVCIRVAVG